MSEEEKSKSIKRSMIYGSIWMIAMRWSIRGIGLISTIILARILMPEDFGVVAMATIVVSLLETLSAFGVDIALIQNVNAKRDHYDTAWTFKILQGTIISIAILIAAPFVGDYFDEQRVVNVIQLLALGVFVTGFENIGVVAFRKELDFSKEFRFGVYKKLITFIVTIIAAVVLENYWALVFGIVTGQFLSVLLSFTMHPFRPRLSWKSANELWSFSQWMLIFSIGNFLSYRADEFVVGGTQSTSQMGAYNVAADLAVMPNTELVMPVSRALLPGYSKLQNDLDRLSSAFMHVFSVIAILAISVSIGLYAVAEDFIFLILGNKWGEAIPVLEWIAIYGGILAIVSNAGNLLVAIGNIKKVAIVTWIYLIALIPALLAIGNMSDIEDIAATRSLLSILYAGAIIFMVTQQLPITLKQIFSSLWRPIAAGLMMYAVIKLTHLDSIDVRAVTLLLDVIIGALSYTFILMALWLLAGKPSGAEKTLLELVLNKIKK